MLRKLLRIKCMHVYNKNVCFDFRISPRELTSDENPINYTNMLYNSIEIHNKEMYFNI